MVNAQTLLLRMVAMQALRPLAERAGVAGEFAVERFAEVLATRMEAPDGSRR